ncbi:MAG TPA: Stk1 family PASTA domain-containing Ser/Thr kinase [Mycobacteriales bacterium]|nr:Stk1 family PASTA domain-containing Ser/Thr kinase [Mycobacteriales bacterium]
MDSTLSDPMVGRLLDDRYAVESFIAHGGMASVYLATDTRLERRVAVKVLHAHLAGDRETLARFEREARAAARLSHPNVVAVYDQGTDGDRPFLVMEYVPGATLRQVLRDRGKLSPAETLTVMDHVLAALAVAHRAGLVHRDIKPENVLITADGRVKVADFGLARAVAGSTVTTTGSVLFGTAAYLAPEQFQHGTADERSDVYSAGVVMFELLTGGVPYTGDSAYAVLHKHAYEDIPAPSTRAAGIPPQVDALVTWATSRDPAQRPADAGELHASLVDVRDKLGLHAAVPGLPVTVTTPITEAGPAATDAVTKAVPAAAAGGAAAAAPPAHGGRQRRGFRDRFGRRGPVMAGIVALAVIAAAILGWWFADGRYTHTPRLLGDTQQAAEAALNDAGLHVKYLAPVHSIRYAKDQVAKEMPGPGDRIAHGGTVTLRMSLGPAHHQLPSLAGESVSAATTNLNDLHIGVGDVKKIYDSAIAKGDVVRTDPAAGATVAEGSKITLYVSKGPAPITIPSVAGENAGDATKTLTDLGLVVDRVDQYNSSVPNGQAITTHPGTGHAAHEGDSVTLVVSKGPHLYPVPNVVGMPLSQAIPQIVHAGFKADPKAFAPGGPQKVFRESPTGNQPKGTTIELDYY